MSGQPLRIVAEFSSIQPNTRRGSEAAEYKQVIEYSSEENKPIFVYFELLFSYSLSARLLAVLLAPYGKEP